MGQSRYVVGIDLGTTNSALSYVDLADPAETPPIRLYKIPQLVDQARVEALPWLPSFLYLPGAHDLPTGATALPWDPGRDFAVGTFARDQGALVPARLVASAKSWLCHSGVDREQGILPWGSPSDVPHVSPIDASSRYLQHMREAWDQGMSNGRPEWTLSQSDVVLTVPASFDEVARELTVRAARQAGLERLTLLEEPQAAFYSWVRSQGEFWREQLSDGQQVLVCDVGGGTTDFSLIAVRGSGAEMTLERVAVGDHLMLGGDNMDLALARHVERRLVKRAGELDARQWGALVHSCRSAKEGLLGPTADDRFAIHLAGRGSKVVGGSLRVDLFRDEVVQLILDGFFPRVSFEQPAQRARLGLQELGLPYASDPAIPRNLSAFLRRHAARPDAVLFNGGAMKATMAQDRIVENLTDWLGHEPIVLESQSLDLAVSLGAAAYGLVRAGKGLRIRGGTARAYYLGVEGAAEPGAARRRQAVCLIPFGVEEGQEVRIEGRSFELLTDRPVSFPLASSSAPLGHDPGDLVELAADDELYVELPPLYTVINFDRAQAAGGQAQRVPVRVGGRLSELGTLQLFCETERARAEGGAGTAEGGALGGLAPRAERSDQSRQRRRWDLEFSLRGVDAKQSAAAGPQVSVGDLALQVSSESAQRAADLVREALRQRRRAAAAPKEAEGPQAKNLLKDLEAALGAERLAWPGPLIRSLWTPLWESGGNRGASPEHEAAWLGLAGILLRPGFGDPLDAGRIENLWTVFRAGLAFEDELWSRVGWWVMWRRVSGGLSRGQQLELSNRIAPPLLTGAALKAAGKAGKGKKGKRDDEPGMNRQELAEMWRTVASLERVPASSKEGLGDVALRSAVAGRGDFAAWALGRFGARVPLYGPVEETVPRGKVEAWLDRLLGLDWSKQRGVALAVAQLGRLSGAPARDISERLRATLVDRLRASGAPESLVSLLTEVKVLQESERGQMFGDALPTGLRLSS
jgi:molecular chaperone DnaK (HSP70)